MAREFTPDASVMKELAEDEKLVWMGAPEAFPLLTDDNRKGLTARWLGCIVAAVVLIVAYILITATSPINVWLLILLLGVVAYVAGMPLIDKGNVYKKCKYYITDRRVLLHYGENEIFTLPIKGIKHEYAAAGSGCVHVLLGSCVGTGAKKLRVSAFVPKKDDKGNVTGMVLYNIEDDKNIRDIFS